MLEVKTMQGKHLVGGGVVNPTNTIHTRWTLLKGPKRLARKMEWKARGKH